MVHGEAPLDRANVCSTLKTYVKEIRETIRVEKDTLIISVILRALMQKKNIHPPALQNLHDNSEVPRDGGGNKGATKPSYSIYIYICQFLVSYSTLFPDFSCGKL